MELEARVYRVSPWRRALLWIVLGPFAAGGAAFWVFGDGDSRLAGAVIVGLMGALLAGWEWLLTRTALVLSARGVELRQLGMHLDAPWADVETLSLVRGREGFVVRSPLDSGGARRLAGLSGIGAFGAPLYDLAQRGLMVEQRWIPIEAFAWHARHGTLGRDVARLAPHVRFVATYAETGKPSRTTRGAILFAGIVLAAIAAGVALAVGPADTGLWLATALQCVAAPFIAVRAGVSAWNAFRVRSAWVGVLFGVSTLLALAWTLMAWSQIAGLLDSGPASSILSGESTQ